MKFLFDFFPILLFFITYKLYGFYEATVVTIIASFLQVAFCWLRYRQLEKSHLITLLLVAVLGGATLYFHNELFIKWKPTVINWLFALAFLGSHFIGQRKPLIQRMVEKAAPLPQLVWAKLSYSWIVFFSLMGAINLYVAYNFDTNTWVNFKLFGSLGLTIAFIIIQSVYLAKHMGNESTSDSKTNL